MRRIAVPLLFGLIGAAFLAGLGIWQLQRLEWKQAMLAEIDARIASAPVPLPPDPDAEADRFLPVEARGVIEGDPVRVLVSQRGVGAAYRLISRYDLGDRVVLLDRGIIPVANDLPLAPQAQVAVTGNLHWPDERDAFTPADDPETNTWFARDVDALATHFGTEPVLIIARSITPAEPAVTPLPVSSAGIPNNHLGYAVQWFGLAAVWLGMTAFLVWRIRRRMT